METQLPNGVLTDKTYYDSDRLHSVVNTQPGPTTMSTYTYTLDNVGNRSGMTGTGGPQGYQYDQLYRLTQATYPGNITNNYTYDDVGNRLTMNGASYTYDDANQLKTAPGGLTYGYDPNGNQTSRNGDIFSYDHENRLTKIILSGAQDLNPCYDLTGDTFVDITDISQVAGRFGAALGNPRYDAFYDLNSDGAIDITDIAAVAGQFGKRCPSRFTYNGDGLRVVRGGSWLNSKYVWDVASSLPVIVKETDSHNIAANGQGTDNTYVYGLGLISVTDRTGAQTYFTDDGLGSTSDLTNASATKTDGYTYDVFGAPTHTLGASANNFQFTGQQRDPNSGLDYLRARYYDPTTGRFMTRDPVPGQETAPQTWNQYAYASNNPTTRVDPSGLDSELNPFTLQCASFVLSFLFVALAPYLGPWGVLLAAPLLAFSLYVAGSSGDLVGMAAAPATASQGISAFALSKSPILQGISFWAARAGVAYNFVTCLDSITGDQLVPTVPVSG